MTDAAKVSLKKELKKVVRDVKNMLVNVSHLNALIVVRPSAVSEK